jgi:hypothetical protein
MKVSIQTNEAKYRATLGQLVAHTRKAPAEVIRQQARLLFQEVERRTPPKTLAQGRARVKKDVETTVKPLSPKKLRKPSVRAWYERVREQEGEPLQKFMETIFGKRSVVVPFSPALHMQNRDKRGRAIPTPYVTKDVRKEEAYIAKRRMMIGRARGGWAGAVEALGGSVAAWVSKWKRKGAFADKLNSMVNAHLVGTNMSEWAEGGDEDRIISSAMMIRSRKMLQNIENQIRRGIARFQAQPT